MAESALKILANISKFEGFALVLADLLNSIQEFVNIVRFLHLETEINVLLFNEPITSC